MKYLLAKYAVIVNFTVECKKIIYSAYERHFSEARHINGLRSLGIDYSKIYYEITTISKAIELSNYLEKKKMKKKNFNNYFIYGKINI